MFTRLLISVTKPFDVLTIVISIQPYFFTTIQTIIKKMWTTICCFLKKSCFTYLRRLLEIKRKPSI